MSYFFRTGIVSTAAGLTVTCTVYGDDGVALGSQPAYVVYDFGNKKYGIRLTLADGQTGWVSIDDGTEGWLVNISPPETENADAKTSALPITLLDQAIVGHTNAGTVGEILRYAGAQAGGKWVVNASADTLKLYALDGALLATLPLTPTGGPYTQRGT
jgi:hypothetical protein